MDPLYRPLAALLTRGIQDSASARRACEELEGRSLDVQLERAGLQLRITISGGEAVVGPATDEGADATLAGNLIGFNRLVFGDAADAIRSGLVKLSGDADTAEAFQSLLHIGVSGRFTQDEKECNDGWIHDRVGSSLYSACLD